MIRCAFILLTAIAVLWHATAGCCAHHDHAATEAPESAIPCCGHSHPCGDESSHRHDICDEERPEPNDGLATLAQPETSGGSHCGERCSFPQPEGSGSVLVKQMLATCDLALPVAEPLYAFEASPAKELVAFEAPPPSHVGYALRRHLALGILLV